MTGYFEGIERQALDDLDALLLPGTPLKAEDVNFLSYLWGEEEGGVPLRLSASGPTESGASHQATGARSAKMHTPAVLRWANAVCAYRNTYICNVVLCVLVFVTDSLNNQPS